MALAVFGIAMLYLGICLLFYLERAERLSKPQLTASSPFLVKSTADYRALLTDLKQAKGPVVVQSLEVMTAQAPQTVNAWAPLPREQRLPLRLTLSIPLSPILAHHFTLEYPSEQGSGEYEKIHTLKLGDQVSFKTIEPSSLPNEPKTTLPPTSVLWLNTMIRPSDRTVWLEVTTP